PLVDAIGAGDRPVERLVDGQRPDVGRDVVNREHVVAGAGGLRRRGLDPEGVRAAGGQGESADGGDGAGAAAGGGGQDVAPLVEQRDLAPVQLGREGWYRPTAARVELDGDRLARGAVEGPVVDAARRVEHARR